MELTYHLNVSELYTNSEMNPKEYWPLDYPPLSGYYSYIWGYLLNIFMPQTVALKDSWGSESANHKAFMRFSVIISDLIFFHIPVFLLLQNLFLSKKSNKNTSYFFITLFLILCSPLLVIIDHGHFQYNCVMHGLFIFSLVKLYSNKFIQAIVIFSLCINFKQMGLYYAMPLPFYVLKTLYDKVKNKQNKKVAWIYLILNVVKYGFYTIISMALIWGPWMTNKKYLDVITRIFPLWRGIFEDKVATFWCTLNIIYKINKIPQNILMIFSLGLTLVPSLLACLSILVHYKPSKKIANFVFFIVSMSFFFFSFHVHEKTILVPFLAFLLNAPYLFNFIPSFNLIAQFSLYPLLKREGQHLPYFILIGMSFIYTKYLTQYNKEVTCMKNNLFAKLFDFIDKKMKYLDILNLLFVVIYHLCDAIIPPSAKYPWIYAMVNAAFSFGNFSLFYVCANLKLYSMIKLNK